MFEIYNKDNRFIHYKRQSPPKLNYFQYISNRRRLFPVLHHFIDGLGGKRFTYGAVE